MKSLKIYYTLPYYISETEHKNYAQYFGYEQVSKAQCIPFEMISFQDAPGRFLTDKAVFNILSDTDDSIFPITVLNGKVVKTSALPTVAEFSSWFEELDIISYSQLQNLAKNIKHDDLPLHEEHSFLCCADGCDSCTAGHCGTSNFSLNDLEEMDE